MKVLYISYDGALDPLGYSQILPYIRELCQKDIEFILLTFEKKNKLKDKIELDKLKDFFKKNNIIWIYLPYHKSPSLLATSFDVLQGIVVGIGIALNNKIDIIHARSFIGAIPALFLAKLFNIKFLFDMRGFWPEERLEGKIWSNKGILYRIAKWFEKKFLMSADRIVCLTNEAKKIINNFSNSVNKNVPVKVIPTCTDLTRFYIREDDEDLVSKLNLNNKFVFLYLGSLGTWYMLEEMLEFFIVAKEINPDIFFIVLTPDTELAINKINRFKLNTDEFYVDFIDYGQIPRWISLADCTISFIKPSYSKKSSCPTKFGESLASGVPVIINSGVGDMEYFVKHYKIGVVLERFCREEYINISSQIFQILKDNNNLKLDCRKVAEEYFSLSSGVEIYHQIYNQLKVEG